MIKKLDSVPTRLNKNFLLKRRLAGCTSQRPPSGGGPRRSARRYFQPSSETAPLKRTKRDEGSELQKPLNYKTQLCKFFIKGLCNRGQDCTFSHDTKAFPCHAYHLRDNCTRKVCRFSHLPITLEQLKQLREEEGCEGVEFMSTFQDDT